MASKDGGSKKGGVGQRNGSAKISWLHQYASRPIRFTLTFPSSPWALSHRSCESEIKLSPKLPTDVELEDNPCFKSPFPPPSAAFIPIRLFPWRPSRPFFLSSSSLYRTGWACVCASNRLFTLSLSWALQIEFELMPLTRTGAKRSEEHCSLGTFQFSLQ